MDNRVLFVDDDEELLQLFSKKLGGDFNLTTATSPAQGLDILKDWDFKVIVSDYDMPITNGIEFLNQVQEVAPKSVRMMLTGNNDLAVAREAVNSGEVYRFESKPIVISKLRTSVHACIHQFDMQENERILLEKTLNGAVKVLKDMLSMASPLAFSRTNRLCNYATQL